MFINHKGGEHMSPKEFSQRIGKNIRKMLGRLCPDVKSQELVNVARYKLLSQNTNDDGDD